MPTLRLHAVRTLHDTGGQRVLTDPKVPSSLGLSIKGALSTRP